MRKNFTVDFAHLFDIYIIFYNKNVYVKGNELVLDSSEDCNSNSGSNSDQEVIHEEEIEIESIAENRCNIQQFDVLKTLGRGAFGEVFLVRRNCGTDKGKVP